MESWEIIRGQKKRQAYDRLAETLYPEEYTEGNESRTRCIQRVYTTFRTAEQEGQLKLKNRTDKEFWKFTIKKYPVHKYPQLLACDWIDPDALKVHAAVNVTLDDATCSSIAIATHFKTDQEYKDAYIISETERIRLESLNKNLQKENEELKKAVNDLEEKLANRRKYSSKIGGKRY